ncbi:hypothetical protein BDN71DRAFT_1177991 [Pleurotus eryngii]|uniref:Uncharacterized protein n=1 Tax=Pleurotus eryngii TaxID=5323 RepID=A0A9P5ZT46_PLEER|nr:hypothetical protein BDN71DRAFT_1177991 [Pleurotus eryngii]
MINKGVNFAMLSSYARSYFFIRDPRQPGKMFMSREYNSVSSLALLATCAFTALALGLIPLDEVYFPPVDTTWNGLNNWTGVGPNPNMFSTAYDRESKSRPASLQWVDAGLTSSDSEEDTGRKGKQRRIQIT